MQINPPAPSNVPVLAWVGELDVFEPAAVRARLARLSKQLTFIVEPGWAHDFGPDTAAGTAKVAQRVRAFLAVD